MKLLTAAEYYKEVYGDVIYDLVDTFRFAEEYAKYRNSWSQKEEN